MTDNEALCTAIVTAGGMLAASIRLSVRALKGLVMRVVKAIDDSTAAWKDASTKMTSLAGEVKEIKQHINIEKKLEQAVEAVVDEVSGVHTNEDSGEIELANTPVVPRRQTPAGGYAIQKRPHTRGR